jgi:serine phosphatase RsbU (regulator of sigma subunit)
MGFYGGLVYLTPTFGGLLVTEASNQSGTLFSESRLEAALSGALGCPPTTLVQAVTDAVRGFVDKAEQSDDITAMAIRINGS